MIAQARATLLALAAFACAAHSAEPGLIRLGAASPEAGVELRTAGADVLRLDIVRIINPARNAFNLMLVGEDGEIVARVAAFPADRPARFAVRAPQRRGHFRLRLEHVDGRALPDLVEVRIGPLDRRR